jgi:hypothetical protein
MLEKTNFFLNHFTEEKTIKFELYQTFAKKHTTAEIKTGTLNLLWSIFRGPVHIVLML